MAAFESHLGSAISNSGPDLAITVPAGGVAVGRLLYVRGGNHNTGRPITSISDSRGNTYASLVDISASGSSASVWQGVVSTALQAGDTITVTFAGKGRVVAAVDVFSGTTSTADGTNATQGTSTTPSSGSISPANAADVLLAHVFVESDQSAVFTEDADTAGGAGWTSLTVVDNGTNDRSRAAYKITTSATSQTYNPTFDISVAWSCLLAALQAEAGGAADELGALMQQIGGASHTPWLQHYGAGQVRS